MNNNSTSTFSANHYLSEEYGFPFGSLTGLHDDQVKQFYGMMTMLDYPDIPPTETQHIVALIDFIMANKGRLGRIHKVLGSLDSIVDVAGDQEVNLATRSWLMVLYTEELSELQTQIAALRTNAESELLALFMAPS